eukprot:2877862-Heterocapsa_arctica.AAC.1
MVDQGRNMRERTCERSGELSGTFRAAQTEHPGRFRSALRSKFRTSCSSTSSSSSSSSSSSR